MSLHMLILLALISAGFLRRQPSTIISQETCATQAEIFLSKRTYENCTKLPYLNATLHYTYNPVNYSLDIAYIATLATGGGWIAWSINPTATGMVGSQALIALKPTGGSTVVVKTFNVSSYSSVVESSLSFAVWGLAADEVNGTMCLFGSVKVPTSASSLNQVWQVGGTVTGTQPQIHPLGTVNKQCVGTLELVSLAPSPPLPSALPPRTSQTQHPTSIKEEFHDQRRLIGIVVGIFLFVLAFVWGLNKLFFGTTTIETSPSDASSSSEALPPHRQPGTEMVPRTQ